MSKCRQNKEINSFLPKSFLSKRLTCKLYLKVNSFRKHKNKGRKPNTFNLSKRKKTTSNKTPHNTSQFLIKNQQKLSSDNNIQNEERDFIVLGSMINCKINNTTLFNEDIKSVSTSWEDE